MGCFVRGGKNGMGCYVRGDKNGMGCYVRGDKTAWDVLSGVANLCGMFCPGCKKMAWDVLSRDVLSGSLEPVLSLDKCVLLKDHNAVTPARLEPAAPRSHVRHSTTELPY